MSKTIEFLQYLHRSGADTESIDVTKKLAALGFETDRKSYDFLNALARQKYIEWSDERPTYTDVSGSLIMSMPKPNAELKFIAQLTITGLSYVEERTFKARSTRGIYISITVAFIFGLSTAYLGYSNRDKDDQIEALQAEIAKSKTEIDSNRKSFDAQLKLQRELLNQRIIKPPIEPKGEKSLK